jgi:predicted Zn-dependent peptidase
MMERSIRHTRLANGLTVVSEQMPAVRSVSLGIWVKIGARFEPRRQAGVSHFIEHMLFKGTPTRSARDIAFAIDAMGGQLDAFTTKEHACYYANVLDDHAEAAFDLLSDLVLHPSFDAAEMDRERAVILEELAAVEDAPEELLWEEFIATFWLDHPLGIPILGTRETVSSLQPDDLRAFFRRAYDPANVVVAACGHLEHEAVAAMVQERFAALSDGSAAPPTSPPRPFQHFRVLRREELEQVHVSVGCPAPPAADERRYAAYLLNAVLGGSISSRLFQRIREEHGLAYNVYSTLETYADAGCFWIYAGTRADAAATVLELAIEELGVLCDLPVPDDELSRMKENLKGNVMLGLESTAGRMSALAQQEIYFGRTFDLDEIIAGIDAVNAKQLQQLSDTAFDDAGIAVDVLAQRGTADKLVERFGDGLPLPGGARITPE